MTKQYKNAGIYILRNRNNGKCYVGKDSYLHIQRRVKQHLSLQAPKCKRIHAALLKYSADAFDVQLIPYPGISEKALKSVEIWHIAKENSYRNGYNCTKGGDGMSSEQATRMNLKRVAAGTNPFLYVKGDKNYSRTPEGRERIQQNNLKRLAAGTHNWSPDKHPCKGLTWETHPNATEFTRAAWRDMETIVNLYEGGLYHRQIAEKYNVNRKTIGNILKKAREIGCIAKPKQLTLFDER